MVILTHSNNHIKATLNYITRKESKPLFVGKNLCDYDPKDLDYLGNQFKAFQRDIKDSYYHIKVAWHPKDPNFKLERMNEAYSCIIQEMNLTRNASICFAHRNTGSPHLHIAVSKQSFDLNVHDDGFIGLKSKATAIKFDKQLGYYGPPQMKSLMAKMLTEQIQKCNHFDAIEDYLIKANLKIDFDKKDNPIIRSTESKNVLTFNEIPQIFFEHIQLLKEEKKRQKRYEQKKQRSLSL
ncbi:relaxase/mobilization nuclease domain-containing protein [Ekhidna sp.]|uniref:relaxase/mobilization nuclease domain-containing protein n=1 Tax=Ekhidna sp. TaxID=2608089 RepID=UPI003CCBD226